MLHFIHLIFATVDFHVQQMSIETTYITANKSYKMCGLQIGAPHRNSFSQGPVANLLTRGTHQQAIPSLSIFFTFRIRDKQDVSIYGCMLCVSIF
jgi:hypothetical protein